MSAKKPKIQKIEAPKTNNRIEQLRYLAALRGEVEQEAPKLNVKRFLIVSAIIVAILVGGIIFTSMKINEITAYNEGIYRQQIEAARAAAGMTAEEAAEAEAEAGAPEEADVPEAPAPEPAAEEAAPAAEQTVEEEAPAPEAPAAAETPVTAETAAKAAEHPEHIWNAVKLVLMLLTAGLLVISYILLTSKPALRTKRNVIALAVALVLLVGGILFTSSQAAALTKQTAAAAAVETTAEETADGEAPADGEAAAGETAAADSGTVAGIDNSISTWNLARVLLIVLLVVYAFFMLVKLAHPKRRKPNRSFWGDLGIYLLMAVFAVAMAFPLVFSIASSLKPLDELFRFPPRVFAQHVTLDNFSDLFVTMGQSYVPFSRYLTNTVFITFIGTFGHVIIASMAAFVLAKYDFPGGKTFFSIVVTALMFSGYVTGIPNYVIMSRLGMIDTYWAIILPAFAAPIGLFLMKQFMEGLPTALIEAAHLDGAGEFRIFWSIVMPNVKPAWLTIIIFSVQGLWNTNAATVIYTEKQKTLVYALQQIQAGGIARTGQAAAVTVIVMLVPIIIFILSQSRILETMASSGLKD